MCGAGISFIGVVGGRGGNACLGARCRSGRRGSEHRYAKRRICPGFLPLVGELRYFYDIAKGRPMTDS